MVALVREINMQLLVHSLDIHVSYSTYLPTFKSQKPSSEVIVITSYLYISMHVYIALVPIQRLRKPRERVEFEREHSPKYSLNLCVSQSIFLQTFRSQKGLVETLNFLIIIP